MVDFSPLSETVNIFFSLAREDHPLFEQLRKHLVLLKRQGLIEMWCDSTISAGSNIGHFIETYMNMADIIVLLISADFLASEHCCGIELKRALELSARGVTRVIPVILRPSEWQMLPLEQYSPLPSDGKAVSLWENRDAAFAEVAKGIRQVVEELAGRMLHALQRPKHPQAPLQMFPHRQNPFFTDRDEILAALHTYFIHTQATQTRQLALTGLGGMGKTQIAIEYVYRYQDEYQTILWLRAGSRETLSAEVASLADQLSLSAQDRADEQRLFAAVKRWLHFHDHWLMVLDNLMDFRIADALIPAQGRGHILMITHSQATGAFGPTISVAALTTSESAFFLLRRAKLIAEDAARDAVNVSDYHQACQIAQEFDGYPLALDQAGAYIEETGRSLASYLALYRERKVSLLGMRGRYAQDHVDPVTTTLSLAFEQIALDHPITLELLRLFAFSYPDAIPDEMIVQGASELSGPLSILAADPLALDQALATLRRFSLVQRCSDTTTLSLHRIVQIVLLDALSQEDQRRFASQVVLLVNHVFPTGDFATWTICERYLFQAQHCAELIANYHITSKAATDLLQHLGRYCHLRALHADAETFLTQALHLCEEQFGPEHLDTALCMCALASLYNAQGRYQQAEHLYQHALSIHERAYGFNQAITAFTLNNLALTYRFQGAYQRAEQLQLQAVSIYEQTLGLEHPDTASALNNLAVIYRMQGQYQRAEDACQRALSIRESVLDPHHPRLAYSLTTLATLYQVQGKYRQAEPLLQRALLLREQAYGPDHLETAVSLHYLAALKETQGDDQQAEALYQRVLTLYEQILGPEHPKIADVLHSLAFLFEKQAGQYERAEPLYQRALAIYERTIGIDHPSTAATISNLGVLYRLMGRYEQAEPLLRRSLEIRERLLGADHIETSWSLNTLATLLTAQGDYEQAEPLFQRALAIRQAVLGPEHADVALVLEQYAILLEQVNRTEQATAFRQTVRTIQEKFAAENEA